MKESFSVSGFYRWSNPDHLPERAFDEFAAAGTRFLSVDADTTKTLSVQKGKMTRLCAKAESAGLIFRDAHAPWGPGNDLNEITTEDRFSCHETTLAILGDHGIRTCTYHIGASCIYEDQSWFGNEEKYRSIAAKALERLLKTAEKYKIVLCVENCFEPSTTAQEAMGLVKRVSSPYTGLCFDCGHANLMEPMEKRDVSQMVCYIKKAWEPGIPDFTEKIAEFMMPEIVTVHVHDNDGLNDCHALPEDGGTVNWERINNVLAKAPRLISLQSEISTDSIENPIKAIPKIVSALGNLWKFG